MTVSLLISDETSRCNGPLPRTEDGDPFPPPQNSLESDVSCDGDSASLDDCIDKGVLAQMRQHSVLAQLAGFSTLVPLTTPRDFNCLPHAVSLAVHGREDKGRRLRDLIRANMSGSSPAAQYFRTVWTNALLDWDLQDFGQEVERSRLEWQREWAAEVQLVQDVRSSLTEIHVFILAHIVRRPIIVYSPAFLKDQAGRDLAPIRFGGVYLPLLLRPGECRSASPVTLLYLRAHFSPLVPAEPVAAPVVVPLTDETGRCLPIQFADQAAIPPGSEQWRSVLSQYLTLCEVPSAPHGGAVVDTRSHFLWKRGLLQNQKHPELNTISNSSNLSVGPSGDAAAPGLLRVARALPPPAAAQSRSRANSPAVGSRLSAPILPGKQPPSSTTSCPIAPTQPKPRSSSCTIRRSNMPPPALPRQASHPVARPTPTKLWSPASSPRAFSATSALSPAKAAVMAGPKTTGGPERRAPALASPASRAAARRAASPAQVQRGSPPASVSLVQSPRGKTGIIRPLELPSRRTPVMTPQLDHTPVSSPRLPPRPHGAEADWQRVWP